MLRLLLAAWLFVTPGLFAAPGPRAPRALGPYGQVATRDAPAAAARQRALAWLHAQQLPDGSFGPRLGNATPQGSAASTADVVYVLALLGQDPAGPAWAVEGHSALDALARLAPAYVGDDAGQAGKVARAVAAAGRDPRTFGGLDLIGIIKRDYDPTTGRYDPDLLYRHTLAIEGLARAGEPVPPAAFDALWQARMPDGGWFWAFTGEQSDVDTTGRVMYTLAAFGGAADGGTAASGGAANGTAASAAAATRSPVASVSAGAGGLRCAPALAPAAAFLAAKEAATADWGASIPPGPPNADSTALSVAGLASAGYDLSAPAWARGGRDPLAGLLAFQEPSGAFVYINQPGREEVRLAATVDALTALVPSADAPACNPFYLPVLLHPKQGEEYHP